jgi:GntR family transcriptional regulator
MMTHVDIDSSVAVYVQIENHVQFAIAAGKIKSGDQLPSVRELSERLGVNPNTVAKAYRDLEVMGLLYTRRGMGVFVNKGIESRCREDTRKKILGRLHEVISEAKASGFSDSELVDVAKRCAANDAEPYGPTPASILALARGGSAKKKK